MSQDHVPTSTDHEFALLDGAPLPTCVYDPEGHCIYANAAWEDLWSLPRAVALRHNILQDPLLADRRAQLRRSFAGERVELPTMRYDPAINGVRARPRAIRTHLAPFLSRHGKRYVVARFEDLTGAVDESRTHSAIMEALSEMGIGIVLREGERTTWANDAYEQLTGYCLAELVSPDFDPGQLFPADTAEARAQRNKERVAGLRTHERAERELLRKDGKVVRVEVTTRTTHVGPPPRLVRLVRAIP